MLGNVVGALYIYDRTSFPDLKAVPWNDINFRIYFRTEVVYPTIMFFFFRIFIFLQIFLINISMKLEVTQTNYLYT